MYKGFTNRRNYIFDYLFNESLKPNFYYESIETKAVPFENNILTIDVPGYSREDLSVTYHKSILTVKFKDCDKKYSYQILEGLDIESCKCIHGQLIIKFVENDDKEFEIDIN